LEDERVLLRGDFLADVHGFLEVLGDRDREGFLPVFELSWLGLDRCCLEHLHLWVVLLLPLLLLWGYKSLLLLDGDELSVLSHHVHDWLLLRHALKDLLLLLGL